MTEPMVIDDQECSSSLGIKMPPKDITIDQISQLVGPSTPLEVIDVATQADLSRWTLEHWSRYYQTSERDRIRNVISLEVSETPLGSMIELPKLVRQIDWVYTVWPDHLRFKPGNRYPKVQKYCLMSVAGCWTDWHIDFAGSSVYYHILRGAKTFYFIRPTLSNLSKYQKWSGSSRLQESTWLGDQVNVVYKVSLTAGQTMIIPTGWIHAVHTPIDSLVFGGNFLHSLNIPLQLRIHQIEDSTKVPKKFRFPFFTQTLWFVVNHYLKRLEDDQLRRQTSSPRISSSSDPPINLDSSQVIPERILSGLSTLSDYLLTRADLSPADDQSPLSSAQLSSFLENHLHHDRIPNLRPTILKFQKLLQSVPSNSSSNKPMMGDPRSSCLNDSNLVDNQCVARIEPEEDCTKPTKSSLQIKIKRKITHSLMNQPANQDLSDHSSLDPPIPKKPSPSTAKSPKRLKSLESTEEHKLKPTIQQVQPKFKLAQQIARLNSASKKNGEEILMISNPVPTNQIEFERRRRPKFDRADDHQDDRRLPRGLGDHVTIKPEVDPSDLIPSSEQIQERIEDQRDDDDEEEEEEEDYLNIIVQISN